VTNSAFQDLLDACEAVLSVHRRVGSSPADERGVQVPLALQARLDQLAAATDRARSVCRRPRDPGE
jgi:hypothetical protein